jgi:hypothetical protein
MTHGNTRILLIIMPNPKGHEDSIKDSRFKAAWQSGPTRTIRVPIALAEVTLEYARQLDQGIKPRDTGKIFNKGTDTVIAEPHDTRQYTYLTYHYAKSQRTRRLNQGFSIQGCMAEWPYPHHSSSDRPC